jgi:hypothetical protein
MFLLVLLAVLCTPANVLRHTLDDTLLEALVATCDQPLGIMVQPCYHCLDNSVHLLMSVLDTFTVEFATRAGNYTVFYTNHPLRGIETLCVRD